MARKLRYTPTRGQAGDPNDKVATPEQAMMLVMKEAERRGIKGFKPYMAAGIVGSLMQESGNFRRDVVEQQLRGDDGTAFGVAQWRNDRKSNLDNFLKQRGLPSGSLSGQIAFAFEEMDPSSPFNDSGATRALKGIMSSENVSQAATQFIHFERPAGYGENKRNPALSAYDRTKRINHATNAFGSFSGNAPSNNMQNGDRAQVAQQPSRKGSVKFEYVNAGKIRNKPIQNNLKSAIINAAEQTDGISRVVVFSGGQEAKGKGKRRTGSTRHDHGNSADIYLYDDKNNLLRPDNPKYHKVLGQFTSNSKRQGITGIGAGEGYMGGMGMHVGYGKPVVWGAGGKSKNAPEWLSAAYNGTEYNPKSNSQASSNSTGQTASSYAMGSQGDMMSGVSAKDMLNKGGMDMFNSTPKLALQFGDIDTSQPEQTDQNQIPYDQAMYSNPEIYSDLSVYNDPNYMARMGYKNTRYNS